MSSAEALTYAGGFTGPPQICVARDNGSSTQVVAVSTRVRAPGVAQLSA